MLSAAMPLRGSSPDPGVGLRRLAQLVNDALMAMGAQPRFVLDGPEPVVVQNQVMDTAPTHSRTQRASGRHSHRPSPEPEQPEEPEYVDEQHVDTWGLVGRAQQGDGEAFGQLYDRYVDTVFRFIYFRVNDRALAEDFTSETFLRALRRIGTISYQGRDIGAWFITIARNIILDHMKSARHRLEITTADTVEGDDRMPSTETAVMDSLASEQLMAAVRLLGEEQRECVLLRFIQGFSVSETAQVMGKNEGAIKALQHRAVRKLAELIGEDIR